MGYETGFPYTSAIATFLNGFIGYLAGAFAIVHQPPHRTATVRKRSFTPQTCENIP